MSRFAGATAVVLVFATGVGLLGVYVVYIAVVEMAYVGARGGLLRGLCVGGCVLLLGLFLVVDFWGWLLVGLRLGDAVCVKTEVHEVARDVVVDFGVAKDATVGLPCVKTRDSAGHRWVCM